MRTNDKSLSKQQWLWDTPPGELTGPFWDSMRQSTPANNDALPLTDDLSDGYIADRMYWDAMETAPACPCSPTELDSEHIQDFGSTPVAVPDWEQSADDMALEPSGAISIATLNQLSEYSEPYIPLDDGCWEASGADLSPVPPQISVKPEAIRPEDATDHSVPSLDDLREGKSDTMGIGQKHWVFFGR